MTRPNVPGVIAYRPDIDGLRALAVIPVLMFHFFPKTMPGGYVGVDIFFVISGYLITGILLGEVAQNRFSIVRFYIRRARRLFPALFLVLATVLLFGWLILFPSEFKLLGKQVFAGSTFISNIMLWLEVGYFDKNANLKPLLHLWSLGVEEQYYLLWPLMVFLLARRSRLFIVVTVSLALISFALNIGFIERAPSTVFYLPITRFWELLIGGLLSFAARRQLSTKLNSNAPNLRSHALSTAGLIMIVTALLKFDDATVFPGWAALLPVLGAALIIAAGPRAIINRTLLSSRPAVWIGLISYPLYLWHWPLISYAHILLGQPIATGVGIAIAAGAIALAYLTYLYIEKPVASPSRTHIAGYDALKLWLLLGILGVCGVAAWQGWLQPQSAASNAVQRISQAQADWKIVANGKLEGDTAETVLFIGDSFMQQYLPRIDKIMSERTAPTYSVEFATLGGCAPLRGIERKSIKCSQFVDNAYALAQAPSVKTIVIAAAWWGFSIRTDYYLLADDSRKPIRPFADENRQIFVDWGQDLKQLIQAGKRVILVTSSPSGPLVDPTRLVDRSTLHWQAIARPAPNKSTLQTTLTDTDRRIREVARTVGAEVIDPFDWLCGASSCPTVDEDDNPIFMDDAHLRATYVRNHIHMFDSVIYIDGLEHR